ncbi:MAG: hypothetical protein IT443_03830 [Phycisphaeraceae bacterium]|nr:hypothetical protein [Phycisphaeraceae bacterium]
MRRNSSPQPSDGDSAPHGANPNHAPAQAPPQVVLVKDGQRFVFQCAPGDESALLANLAKMAQDPKAGLNWFDAAVLSHQVGQHMRQQLKQMLKA